MTHDGSIRIELTNSSQERGCEAAESVGKFARKRDNKSSIGEAREMGGGQKGSSNARPQQTPIGGAQTSWS